MLRKKYVKEYFVVSAWTNYGIRLYLSNIGFITQGVHHAVWEPGFGNAKEFLTKKDAIDNGRIAASDLSVNTEFVVIRLRILEDSKVEMDQVHQGGSNENIQSNDKERVSD